MRFDEAVLLAIYRGLSKPKSLAEVFHVDERDMIEKLRLMEVKGLVKCRESGFLIFKSVRCNLTERGFEVAQKAYEELQRRASELKERLESISDPIGREAMIKNLILNDSMWAYVIPLMMWFNMLPSLITLSMLYHMYDDFFEGGDVGGFEEVY